MNESYMYITRIHVYVCVRACVQYSHQLKLLLHNAYPCSMKVLSVCIKEGNVVSFEGVQFLSKPICSPLAFGVNNLLF